MKNHCYAIMVTLSLWIGYPAIAQDKGSAVPPPSTKLESFLAKRGLIFIRDIFSAGKVERKKTDTIGGRDFTTTEYWVYIAALAVYEPGHENSKIKGLQCSVVDFRGRGSSSNVSFLDLDEAESLSVALQYLIDLAAKWKGQDVGEKEVFFVTKDDFKIGFSQEKSGEPRFFVSSGRIGATSLALSSVDELSQLKKLVDSGVDWLKKQ